MKRLAFILLVLGTLYFVYDQRGTLPITDGGLVNASAGSSDQILADAFKDHRSNFQIENEGVVTRVLSDDTDGGRHQRLIIRLASGQTLLIAHNIDLAPRLTGIRIGDKVQFSGEYEWNSQGGVIHWTHRDPKGSHTAGWLKYNGRLYQ